jgi:hypothetical protein
LQQQTSPTTSKAIASATTLQLQPKKSSSPLSKIKFHSITKKKLSGNNKKVFNEKFHLINKKHAATSSSSSFINDDDDYDYFSYKTANDGGGNKSASSSLKRYLLFKFGDKSVDSDTLEAKNLFHLKRHHHSHEPKSSDNDFDVLDF